MHRSIMATLAAIFIAMAGIAQPVWHRTDSLTWQYYLEGQWRPLLNEAEKSFRDNIDFYYLRVRAGIAAMELKNYRKAAAYLQKASDANPSDDFVTSSLYSAFSLAGMTDDAARLADRMSDGKRDTLKIRTAGVIRSVGTEALRSFNENADALAQEDFATEGSYSNYRSILKSQQYHSLSVDMHLSPKFNLYQHFSLLNIRRDQHFFSGVTGLDASRETFTHQYQYYAGGRFLMEKGWSGWGALTRIWGESKYHYPLNASGGSGLAEAAWDISDFLVNGGVAKDLIFLRPEISISIGEVNRFMQFQANAGLTVYPFGNANLYSITRGSYHADKSSDDKKFVVTEKVGIKTGPVWLIGEAAWGTIRNFNMENGLVVYNMPESIKHLYGGTLWIPLFNYRLNLSLRYQFSAKEGYTSVYTDTVNYYSKPYNFDDHSFLISLRWIL